jgi:predicted ATP-dependent Lon-type protease
MNNKNKAKNRRTTKTFKSLYEVKNTYIPNKDLKFLEGQDEEFTRDTFMKILAKVARPMQPQSAQEK